MTKRVQLAEFTPGCPLIESASRLKAECLLTGKDSRIDEFRFVSIVDL